jgi:uncharacterized protein (TIGR02145 family)
MIIKREYERSKCLFSFTNEKQYIRIVRSKKIIMGKSIVETVTIGTQVWMKNNLSVLNFQNGDEIPIIKENKKWEKAGDKGLPACCLFNNDESKINTEGVLYNWFAISDPRGIMPEGFRVPTIEDWIKLALFIGGKKKVIKDFFRKKEMYLNVAKIIKSKEMWEDGGDGTDEFGLSVWPFGQRSSIGNFSTSSIGSCIQLWSLDETNGQGDRKELNFAKTIFLNSESNDVVISEPLKASGIHVRGVAI